MLDECRILQKAPSYYEYAMQQANQIKLFNQSSKEQDFQLHVLWCRYIHHIRMNYSKKHTHSFFELHCMLNGRSIYHDSERPSPILLNTGKFILISPQSEHFITLDTDEAEIFAVAFNPICEDSDLGKLIKTRLDSITCLEGTLTPEVCSLIELILQEFHESKSFSSHNIKSLLRVLMLHLIQDIFKKDPPVNKSEFVCDPRIEELTKYLNDNPNAMFSVEDSARYLNLGAKQLNNIIRLNSGISAKNFIDQIKADQARKLLLETELNLQTISERLGFSDHNNFGRFFKRVEGLPPGRFRLSKGKQQS